MKEKMKYQIPSDRKLTPHFRLYEMRCKCTNCFHTCAMDAKFMIALETLRKLVGKTFTITSGFRCNSHQKEVNPSSPNSGHTRGVACDFYCDEDFEEIAKMARVLFYEVRIYKDKNFIHVGFQK